MPSSSEKQSKFMTANCKSVKLRKKTRISKKVACDFHNADKGVWHETSLFSGLAKSLCESFGVEYSGKCEYCECHCEDCDCHTGKCEKCECDCSEC